MENVYNGDLVIVGDKKLGIFNRKTCKYLTSKTFDAIQLNNCGCHILEKRKFLKKDKDGRIPYDITYSAIIKDDGTIIECPNLYFDYYENKVYKQEAFERKVAIAYSTETKKRHLVNCDGEIISKGYDRIERRKGGLFYGINYKNRKEVKNIKMLNSKGKVLPFTFTLEDNNIYGAKINEINSLEEFKSAIEKFGLGIVDVAETGRETLSDIIAVVQSCAKYLTKTKDLYFDDAYLLIDKYKIWIHSFVSLDMKYNEIDIAPYFSDVKENSIIKNFFVKHFMTQVIEPLYIYNVTRMGYDWREAMYNNNLVDIFDFNEKKPAQKKTTTKAVKKTETTKKTATKKATTTKKK